MKNNRNGGFIFIDIMVKLLIFAIIIGIIQSFIAGLFSSHHQPTKPSEHHKKTHEVASQTNQQTSRGIAIGFFNGVAVEKGDAGVELDLLSRHFGSESPTHKTLKYEPFYNDSYGLMLDLVETYDQRTSILGSGDQFNNFWLYADGNRQALNAGLTLIASGPSVVNVLWDAYSAAMSKYMHGLHANETAATGANHRHLIDQLTSRKDPQDLIFVAHSQGNLFALQSFDYASARTKNLSVIHAAPPIDKLKGDYVLFSCDAVLNILKPVGHILPANIDGSPCDASYGNSYGHGFAEIYFNQDIESGKKTVDEIMAVLSK